MTILRALEALVENAPDQTLLTTVHEGECDLQTSRLALWKEVGRYQRFFQEAGVGPRAVVPIVVDHSVELWGAFLGAMAADLIPSILPIPSFKTHLETYARNLTSLFERYGEPVVCGRSDTLERLAGALTGKGFEVQALSIDEVADFEPREPTGIPNRPDDIAFLQHSSGSTGIQKGVTFAHQDVLRHNRSYSKHIRLTADDRIVSWLPLYHDMGLIACCLQPVTEGVPVVELDPFEWVMRPALLLRKISEHGGTLTWLPNFAYNFMAERVRREELDGVKLETLRMAINCSEPVRAASHDVFLKRFAPLGLKEEALSSCYAMAENVFAVSQAHPASPPSRITVDIESLTPGSEVRPLDVGEKVITLMSSGSIVEGNACRILSHDDSLLPEGFVGEIVLRGQYIFRGYHLHEEATRAAFGRDGLYRTGDLGFVLGDELFVIGRLKDLIIIGGKNFYPTDIEEIASKVPNVRAGRVVAFGSYVEELGTERLVVLVESDLSQDKAACEEISRAIKRDVSQRLDCVVDEVGVLPPKALVKTSSGKIARRDNRVWYERRRSATGGPNV